MPKMSIYVSDEMKARLDKASEQANWSAIAQRAFDLELNHIQTVKEIKSMVDVIERLQASKMKVAANSEDDGRHMGQDWAKHRAEYDELKRVAGLDLDEFFKSYIDDPDWECRKIVATAITGSEDKANEVLKDEEETAGMFGLDPDEADVTLTRECLVGFVKGVTEVWEEVKDQL